MRSIEEYEIPFDGLVADFIITTDFIEWVESIEDGFDQTFLFADDNYAFFREREDS